MTCKYSELDELAEFSEGEKFKKFLMREYFVIDDYKDEGQEDPQKERQDSNEPEEDPRYEIYRKVQHELYVQDAKDQVEDYLAWMEETGQEPLDPDFTFDYEHLSNLFEDMHDCNRADNDVWNDIIDRIVLAHQTAIQRETDGPKNNFNKIKNDNSIRSHRIKDSAER